MSPETISMTAQVVGLVVAGFGGGVSARLLWEKNNKNGCPHHKTIQENIDKLWKERDETINLVNGIEVKITEKLSSVHTDVRWLKDEYKRQMRLQ